MQSNVTQCMQRHKRFGHGFSPFDKMEELEAETDDLFQGKTADRVRECANEMRVFSNAGLPGLLMLRRVMSNMFKYYRIKACSEKLDALRRVGLDPWSDSKGNVGFTMDAHPEYSAYTYELHD